MSRTHKSELSICQLAVSVVLALALVSCGTAQQPAPPTPEPPTPTPQPTAAVIEAPLAPAAPSANLTDRCVETYDPKVDYFPEKVTVEDATGFVVEYFNHYKVVTVLNPWQGAKEQFKYVIVQCGTPAPNIENALVINAPVNDVIAMSTTHLPHLDKLELLDRLIGLDSFMYVNNPKVRVLIDAGALIEIGSGAEVNVEKTLEAKPDLVMTYGVGDPQYDAHPKLLEAKIPTVINAEYMEGTPLGRAEWIKFTALFFNAEAKAQAEYAKMKQRYLEIASKVKTVTNKPTVVSGMASKDRWSVPGGGSYAARLILDAGGAYLWADDSSAGSLSLTFEEVYARAVKADVWLLTSFQRYDSIKGILEAEPRYAEMAAVKGGQVWNYDKRVNDKGGNDYWESGVANPDLLLADLVKILHPSLLPNHELVYWRQIPAEPAQ